MSQAYASDQSRSVKYNIDNYQAIADFNKDPEKGVKQMCSIHGKAPTPRNIAYLILSNKDSVLPEKVTDYLGKKENIDCLLEYFNLSVVESDLLTAFKNAMSGPLYFKGESQVVERIVMAFSSVYHKKNPGRFSNEDIPCNICLYLNVLYPSLHNPNIKNVITLEQFMNFVKAETWYVKNDIPDSFLEEVYEFAKQEHSNLVPDSNIFLPLCAPEIKGTVWKKSDKPFSKRVKRLFGVVKCCLVYSTVDDANHVLGHIQLVDCKIEELNGNSIAIIAEKGDISYVKFKDRIVLVKGIKKIVLTPESDYDKWLFVLKSSTDINNSALNSILLQSKHIVQETIVKYLPREASLMSVSQDAVSSQAIQEVAPSPLSQSDISGQTSDSSPRKRTARARVLKKPAHMEAIKALKTIPVPATVHLECKNEREMSSTTSLSEPYSWESATEKELKKKKREKKLRKRKRVTKKNEKKEKKRKVSSCSETTNRSNSSAAVVKSENDSRDSDKRHIKKSSGRRS